MRYFYDTCLGRIKTSRVTKPPQNQGRVGPLMAVITRRLCYLADLLRRSQQSPQTPFGPALHPFPTLPLYYCLVSPLRKVASLQVRTVLCDPIRRANVQGILLAVASQSTYSMTAAVLARREVNISDGFLLDIALRHVLLFLRLLYNRTSGCRCLAPGRCRGIS